MAIGTAMAIGLGVAGIGSALGARSQSKAAGKAADTSLAVAEQNNALARDIYGQNKQALSPWIQRGNRAGDVMNAFLGLGGPEPIPANNNALAPYKSGSGWIDPRANQDLWQSGGFRPSNPGLNFGGVMGQGFSGYPGFQVNQPQTYGSGTMVGGAISATGTAPTAQEAANDAFDIFKNSSNYQFRLGQGQDALNSGFAGRGILRSGAAAQKFSDYNQNMASNESNNWLSWLSGQQGAGLSGASALAGVGQNYVGQVSANNNNAGDAAANAALIKGQNNPFASIFGTVGGGLLGSSFG